MPAMSGAGAMPAQAGPAPCPTCGGAGMQGGMGDVDVLNGHLPARRQTA